MIFSVIDVETTGLSSRGGDRIVEIGVARLTGDGEVIDAFDTLVNPGGPVRATHVHGITDAMVADAPRFPDIAERLCAVLDGTVLAAHNAGFDMGFLKEEFRRTGSAFPSSGSVCTLILARRYLKELPSKSLESCRKYLGIDGTGAHNALADARAAAVVLRHFIEVHDFAARTPSFVSPRGAADAQRGLFDEPLKPLKPRLPEGARL